MYFLPRTPNLPQHLLRRGGVEAERPLGSEVSSPPMDPLEEPVDLRQSSEAPVELVQLVVQIQTAVRMSGSGRTGRQEVR